MGLLQQVAFLAALFTLWMEDAQRPRMLAARKYEILTTGEEPAKRREPEGWRDGCRRPP
jgi:hypothetical protein